MPIQLRDSNGNLVAMTNAQKAQFLSDLGAADLVSLNNGLALKADKIRRLPINARLVTEGDSLTDYENTGGQNWQFYFTLFTGAKLYRPQGSNLAVGGQKITGLLGDATYISDASQIATIAPQ